MTQLRSSHVHLNSYLNKISRSDKHLCQACLEKKGVHCNETVKHFLFVCLAYVQEREELMNKIGRSHLKILNLRDIMSNTGECKKIA